MIGFDSNYCAVFVFVGSRHAASRDGDALAGLSHAAGTSSPSRAAVVRRISTSYDGARRANEQSRSCAPSSSPSCSASLVVRLWQCKLSTDYCVSYILYLLPFCVCLCCVSVCVLVCLQSVRQVFFYCNMHIFQTLYCISDIMPSTARSSMFISKRSFLIPFARDMYFNPQMPQMGSFQLPGQFVHNPNMPPMSQMMQVRLQ